MPQDVDVSFEFECEHCGMRTEVDGEMRRSLLNAGTCIVCGEPISEENFERQE